MMHRMINTLIHAGSRVQFSGFGIARELASRALTLHNIAHHTKVSFVMHMF